MLVRPAAHAAHVASAAAAVDIYPSANPPNGSVSFAEVSFAEELLRHVHNLQVVTDCIAAHFAFRLGADFGVVVFLNETRTMLVSFAAGSGKIKKTKSNRP